jgi:hypothetical protein
VQILARSLPSRALVATILFVPLSTAQDNLKADWAEAGAKVILRRSPACLQDSITGHGRRQKQAHDEDHDWIGIRRGRCNQCDVTVTFLPPFSPPYTLIARSQAAASLPGRLFLGSRSTGGQRSRPRD